ncbi:MAG: type II toxin-antitoxin system VapC family toxin, partial [Armatimonadetes bacterium]|nr:type II toxin-antitoxin system VapC family toxin [Armatimonadota bacterium]
MSRFVMDCSVTMAWCFEDESDAYSVSLLKQAEASEVLVPWIWPLEVANVLLTGERRNRLTEAASARFLGILRGFPIMVDAIPPA